MRLPKLQLLPRLSHFPRSASAIAHTRLTLSVLSGQVYYELDAERETNGTENEVKIVRIEQLSPFPWDLVDRELRRYPNAEPVWCQEEPMNMGTFFFWKHGV